MDRITFDFEKDIYIMEDNGREHKGFLPGLHDKKQSILLSAGIIQLDLSEIQELFEEFNEGMIDQDELLEKTKGIFEDSLKSVFHDNLN
ncbi:MAG: hypothetical protein K6G61_11985 [Solobacterium sp.]|nr:hypothetical protein [Solobacterium sp.]